MGITWGKVITSFSEIGPSRDAGFDFVQPVANLAANLDEERASRLGPEIREHGLPLVVSAVPLPSEVVVGQQGFNTYVWIENLKRMIKRLSDLGCTKLVWNDGASRRVPVEGAISRAKEQILQFLNLLGAAAQEVGMTILVEPLGPRRSNFFTSLRETVAFLDQVRRENLACALSLRETPEIGFEPNPSSPEARRIRHVLLDNPSVYEGYSASPLPGDGQDYGPFIRFLHGIDYSGTVVLAHSADKESLEYCKQLWKESRA